MDRKSIQRLAKERRTDAKALIGRKRWSGAYYLCGYAVECGLKACLLRHLGESDALFGDRDYVKKELIQCWTHDLEKLVQLSGLEAELGSACGANPALDKFWKIAREWDENSRYEVKTESEAKALFEAVTQNPDGVFLWIRLKW